MMYQLGRRIGRYRVYDAHGSSASTRRTQAWSPEGRRVFIRLFEPRSTEGFAASVARIQHIEHPGVLPILDWGVQEAVSWVARPFCSGEVLADALRQGPLPRWSAVAIAAEIAAALDAVHEQGELVRDLSPDNVLLPEDGGVRLIDLGFDPSPRAWNGSSALTGPLAPGYVAPEASQLGEEGVPSDLYGLGALMFEMFTGRPAYTGPRDHVAHAQIAGPVPRPSAHVPIPVELDELVAELLTPFPSERPATAGEVWERLLAC